MSKIVTNEVITPEQLRNAIEQPVGEPTPQAEPVFNSQNYTPDEAQTVAQTTNVDVLPLPSEYNFYDTEGISVRAIRFRELISIASAQESGSYRSIAEALARTVVGFPGMNMTFGDFQYVMFTQRIRMKKPLKVTWTCSAKDHPEDDPRTNTTVVNSTQFVIKNPNMDEVHKLLDDKGQILPGIYTSPATIMDVVESTEAVESIYDRVPQGDAEALRQANDEISVNRLMDRFAMSLSNTHGKTVVKRREFIENWFDNYTGDTEEAIEKLLKYEKYADHGVEEYINARCEVCGNTQRVDIRFDPTDFFPNV